MKYLDKVMLINDNYEKIGLFSGDIGTIWLPEIRDKTFYVLFMKENTDDNFIDTSIKIQDLKLVESSKLTNEQIAKDLPSNEPWWCIVEDGFIKNLKGEKKNKIAYDYDS